VRPDDAPSTASERCPECDGRGVVRVHYDQDTTREEPCPRGCKPAPPADAGARIDDDEMAEIEEWLADFKTDDASGEMLDKIVQELRRARAAEAKLLKRATFAEYDHMARTADALAARVKELEEEE